MTRARSGFISMAMVLLAVCISGLTAQEASKISVEITAERVEEEVLSTAAHTTIITAEDIEASGATSLVALLEDVAGIQFRSYSGPEQAQVNMRGFGENSFGRVLVLVDGKRLNKMDMQGIQWLSVPLQRVEKIEVVRGGNSVLYGNSAVGGVINIITRGPVNEREFSSTLLYGGHLSETFGWGQINQQQVHAGFGGSDYDLDVDFEHQSTDGYRDRTFHESIGANVNFEGRPTDLLSGRIGIAYNQASYELPGSLSEAQFEETPEIATNQEDEGEEYLLAFDGGAEWMPTPSLSLFLDGGYEYQMRKFDMASWPSFSNTAYNTGQINPRLVIDLPYGAVPLKIVAGGDVYVSALEKADYSDKSRDTLNYEYDSSLQTYGGYTDVSASLSDELEVSAGVRYDAARITAVKESDGLDESDWHQAIVYDGGLRWNPTKDSKVYLKGGTIFRYPFTDEQTIFGAGTFNADLQPETGWNAELGGTLAMSRTLTSSASIYLLQMEDEIAFYDPDGWLGPDPGSNINLDKTRRIGGDLEIMFKPMERVETDLTYSYVQAEFANGSNEGKTVPLVPSHTVRGSVNLLPVKGLEIEPAAAFVSEAFQGGDNTNTMDKVEAYWLADLVVRYQLPIDEDMMLVLRAENLLDAVYSPYVYFSVYYPAAGRTVTLSVSYRN